MSAEELRLREAWAVALIQHAVELMTPDQVGQWEGVRAFLETSPIDASEGLILDKGDVSFLAARLRRLFAAENYSRPEFAKENDAALIGIAGSVIGAILGRRAA